MKKVRSKCRCKQVREQVDMICLILMIIPALIYDWTLKLLFHRQVYPVEIVVLWIFLAVLIVVNVVLRHTLGNRACRNHQQELKIQKQQRFPPDFEPPAEWVGCPVPRPQTPPTLFAAAKVKPEEN